MEQNPKITEFKRDGVDLKIDGLLAKLQIECSQKIKEAIANKFQEIYTLLTPLTRFRDKDKLLYLAIYCTLKSEGVSAPISRILECAGLSERVFDFWKLCLSEYFADYKNISRHRDILQLVYKMSSRFHFDPRSQYLAKCILYTLFEKMKDNKNEVIAAAVVSLLLKLFSKDCHLSLLSKIDSYQEIAKSYLKFISFYNYCPICNCADKTKLAHDMVYFFPKYRDYKEVLMKGMGKSASLEDLNMISENYFGVPCVQCFQIVRNIQGKVSQVVEIQNFIKNYAICPVCGAKNHELSLLKFYHSKQNTKLLNILIKHINSTNLKDYCKGFKLKLGVPCCQCFDTHIENG